MTIIRIKRDNRVKRDDLNRELYLLNEELDKLDEVLENEFDPKKRKSVRTQISKPA